MSTIQFKPFGHWIPKDISVAPVAPVLPGRPLAPVAPVRPVGPVDPVNPIDPVNPAQIKQDVLCWPTTEREGMVKMNQANNFLFQCGSFARSLQKRMLWGKLAKSDIQQRRKHWAGPAASVCPIQHFRHHQTLFSNSSPVAPVLPGGPRTISPSQRSTSPGGPRGPAGPAGPGDPGGPAHRDSQWSIQTRETKAWVVTSPTPHAKFCKLSFLFRKKKRKKTLST